VPRSTSPSSVTVNNVLDGHAVLDLSCLDRLYLSGFVQRLQTPGGVVYFLHEHRGMPIASPAVFEQIGGRFRDSMQRFAAANHIPVVRFRREDRKVALDALPDRKPTEHLHAILVATAALPARDEQLARLECWITRTIGDRDDPNQQQLLHRYAVWHLLRRLRRRTDGTDTTHNQLVAVRQRVRAATVLLDWLTARDLTLETARQGDLETWLASPQATHRLEAGHFVRWARNQKLTSLDFPAVKWGGPKRVIDTETRWQQARWLLHDDTLKPEDRAARLLVLLYAQWPSAVSRLTLDHVQTSDDHVQLRLGREPVVLPESLAGLVLGLVASRRGHAALGDQGTSRWLFPGGQPGGPVSSYQLAQRLRQLGLHSGQSRSTALFQLATELPAAVFAHLLGIHIAVAVAWQRACSGDWAAYAADVSRRTEPTEQ
jgi:hypothetical protein